MDSDKLLLYVLRIGLLSGRLLTRFITLGGRSICFAIVVLNPTRFPSKFYRLLNYLILKNVCLLSFIGLF